MLYFAHMFDTLSQIATGILTAFLSVSFFFANTIEQRFQNTSNGDSLAEHEKQVPTLLPSEYQDREIPRILLDSLQYQQANLLDRDSTRRNFTTNPEEALVNIFCTFTSNRSVRTTTGSGFFIHENGIVLTNAHVAQTLLLETISDIGTTECIIRSGSPAQDKYRAALLYLPPSWIQEHAATIVADAALGTGERDYALLYIKESLTKEPLPARFPALEIDPGLITQGFMRETITAAGYPAANRSLSSLTNDLTPVVANTTVSNLYTFGSNFADLFSMRGSAVGENGSSGGPVLNQAGKVVGMITTRGNDQVDGQGSLRAITISYIDRTITQETGFNLEQSLRGDLPFRAHIYTSTLAPFLSNILARELRNWESAL